MPVTNITALRKNLYGAIDSVIEYNESITVATKKGNAVILSEEEYNAMAETIYLMSSPGVWRELDRAKHADPSEYVDYDPKEKW